jgi:hypothetical protein
VSATESSLITPFGIDSWVELYDSDIKAIAAGPVHYAQQREGQRMDIDRFVRDLQEQFHQLGFGVQVQVWTTEVEGAYGFVVEIQKRLGPTWDPDQMVHEVTHNLLEIPGEQEGFTDTKTGMNELARKEKFGDIKKHKH